jgi:hypothetical protein
MKERIGSAVKRFEEELDRGVELADLAKIVRAVAAMPARSKEERLRKFELLQHVDPPGNDLGRLLAASLLHDLRAPTAFSSWMTFSGAVAFGSVLAWWVIYGRHVRAFAAMLDLP